MLYLLNMLICHSYVNVYQKVSNQPIWDPQRIGNLLEIAKKTRLTWLNIVFLLYRCWRLRPIIMDWNALCLVGLFKFTQFSTSQPPDGFTCVSQQTKTHQPEYWSKNGNFLWAFWGLLTRINALRLMFRDSPSASRQNCRLGRNWWTMSGTENVLRVRSRVGPGGFLGFLEVTPTIGFNTDLGYHHFLETCTQLPRWLEVLAAWRPT